MVCTRFFLRHAAAWSLTLAASLAATAALAQAGLSFDETARLAREQAPTLAAQQQALAGAQAAEPAAATLPDPRLTVGIDNLPVTGPDRGSLTRDFMTMQRVGLMQEVPNAAKRQARAAGAQARVERERALLVVAELAVQRDAALAWLATHFAEQRLAQIDALARENETMASTLEARVAGGKALPAERTLARQEALALADRRDDAQRDIAKARAALRRWVGVRADAPLAGELPNFSAAVEAARIDPQRLAEVAPFAAMQAQAQAEVREADAEQRGDWAWGVNYSRRGPQFSDMVSLQISIDLPWLRELRQRPLLAARQRDLARVEAEREDSLRRSGEAIEAQQAELKALDAQRARLQTQGLPLAGERAALSLASYQAGRADLTSVFSARREALETGLRLIELEAQRAALRVRLSTLIAE